MTALGWGRGPSLVINVIISILMFNLTQQALAAPVLDHPTTEIEPYHGEVNGCYYNFQHYEEGDRILTNEPCLNCTCHNRMLMCYLRVCPFTKAIGQDCKIDKRPDQCCPVITCPEVPVQLLTSTTTQSPATEVGHIDNYGCSINNLFYSDGARVPSDPKKPCELCYCIRNKTTCIMQECTLKVEGCKPVYQPGVCCPVRYDCDREEIELLETTVHPTTGLLLTTTLSPGASTDCKYQDNTYFDGESIHTENPCEHCYCMRGEIVCAVQECGKPMEKTGTNCIAIPKEGQCCPEYECDNTTYVTTLASIDEITTVSGEKNIVENEILEEKIPSLQTTLDGEVQENPQERPTDHINKADDSQIPLTSDLPETNLEIDHKIDQTDLEKDNKTDQTDQIDLEKGQKLNQTDLVKDHKGDKTDLEKDHKIDQTEIEKDNKEDQTDLEKGNKVDETAAPPLDESQTHIPEDWSHKITTESQQEITVDDSPNKIEDYQKDITTESHELPSVIHSEHTDERKTDMKVDNLITEIPKVSSTEKTIDSTTNEKDNIGESEIQAELQKTDTESTNLSSTSEETILHDKKDELLPQISEEKTELPKSDTEPLEVLKEQIKPSSPDMLPSYTEIPQKESSTEIEDYVKGTSHEHLTTESSLMKEKISTSLFNHDYVTNIPPINEIHTTEIDKEKIFETDSKLAPGKQSTETDEGALYTSELPTHTEIDEKLSTSKPIVLPDQIIPQEISTSKTDTEKEVTSYPEIITTLKLENNIENEQVLTATDKTEITIDKDEDVSTTVPLTENIEDSKQGTAKPIKEVSLDVTTDHSQNKDELSPAIVKVEGSEVVTSTSERIDELLSTTQKQERVPETTDKPTEEKIIELETTAKIPEKEIQKAEGEFPLKSEEEAQEQELVTDSQEEKVTEIYNKISPTTQEDSTSDITFKKEEPKVKPEIQYETPVSPLEDNQEITTELDELAKLPELQTDKSIPTSDNINKEKTEAPTEITEEPQKALDYDISSPSKDEITQEPSLPELTTEYTLQEHVKEKTQEPEISQETTEHSYEKHEPEVIQEHEKTQEPEISQATTEHSYVKHEPEVTQEHEKTQEPEISQETTEHSYEKHEPEITQEHEKTQEPEISQETTEHSFVKHEPEVTQGYEKTKEPEIFQETTEYSYEKHEPEITQEHEKTQEPEISQETTEHSYEKHEPEVTQEHEKTQEPEISQETTEHSYVKHEPEIAQEHEKTQEPEISQETTEHSYVKHESEITQEHEKTQEPEISQETTEHLYEKHKPEVTQEHEKTQEPEISQETTEHSYEKHEPEITQEHEKTQEPEISQETTEHSYEKHEPEVIQEHEKTQEPEISQETTEHSYVKHEPEVTQEHEKTQEPEISQETTEHSYEKHEPEVIQEHEKPQEPEISQETTEHSYEKHEPEVIQEHEKTQEPEISQETTEHSYEKHEPEVTQGYEKTKEPEISQETTEYSYEKHEPEITQEHEKTQEPEISQETTEHSFVKHEPEVIQEHEKTQEPEISQETTEHSYEKHEPQITQGPEKTDEPELLSITTERINEEVNIIQHEKDKTQESDLDQVTTEHMQEEKDHDIQQHELPQIPIEHVPEEQKVNASQEYDTDKTQETEIPQITTEHKYKDDEIDTTRQHEKDESPAKITTDKPEVYNPEISIKTTEQPEIIQETTTMHTNIQKDKEKLDEGIIEPVEIEKEVTQINEELKPTEISVNKQTTQKIVTEESEIVDQDINTTTVKVSSDIPHSIVYVSTESIPEIGPQLIPGEGDCLVEKITYLNNSVVPSTNPCQLSCKCISSIVQCVMIECTPPPPEMIRCMPVFHDSDACCPTYNCEGEESDIPKSDSQMKETDEKILDTPPKTPESLTTISMEPVELETSSQQAERTTEKGSTSYIPPKESSSEKIPDVSEVIKESSIPSEPTISSKSTEEIPLSTPSYISVQSSNESVANEFDKEFTSHGPILENKVSNSETSTVLYEERTETIQKLSSVGITLEDDNQQKILNKPEEQKPAVPGTESELDLEEKLETTPFSIFRGSEGDTFTTAEKEITTEYLSEHKYSPQTPEDESSTSSVSQTTTTVVAEVVKDISEEEKGGPSHETVTPFVDIKVSVAEFDHGISPTKQPDENEIETNKYSNDTRKSEESEQSISESTTSLSKDDDKEFSSVTTKKPESFIESSTEKELSTGGAAEIATEHVINKESNEITDKETTDALQDTEKKVSEDQATYKPIEDGINEIIPEQPISSYKPITDSSLQTENEYEITSQQLDNMSPTEKEQSPEFNEILNEVSKLPEEHNFVQEYSTIPSNEIETNEQTTKVTELPIELHKIPTNESNEIADISDFPKELYTTAPIVDSTILKQKPDTTNEADEDKKYTTFTDKAVTEVIKLDDSSEPGKQENLPQKPQIDISTEVSDTISGQHKDTTISYKEQEKETSDKTQQIEEVSTEYVVYQESITTKPDYKEEEKETTNKEEFEEAYTSRVVTEELPSPPSETQTASPEEFYEHSTKQFADDNILQETSTSTTKRAEELTTRKSEENMILETQKYDDTHDTVLDNEKDKEKTNIVPEIEKTSVSPAITEEGRITTEREQSKETISIIPEDEKRIGGEFDSKEPENISSSKPTELFQETTEGSKSGETNTPVLGTEKPFKPTISSLENEISSSTISSGTEIHKTEETTSLISEDEQLKPDLVSVNELIPGNEQYEVTTNLYPEIETPKVHLESEQENPEVTTNLVPEIINPEETSSVISDTEKDISEDKKPEKVESETPKNEKSELTTASISVEGEKSTPFPPTNEITTFNAVSESDKSPILTEKTIEATSIKLPESQQENKTELITETVGEITTSSDNLVKTTLLSDTYTTEAIIKVPEPLNISTSVQKEKQNISTIAPISPQEPDYVQVPIIQEQSTEHIPVSNELYTSSAASGLSTESIHDNLSTQNSLHVTSSVPEHSIGTQKPEDINLQHVPGEPYKPSYPDNFGQIPQHVPEQETEHHKPSKPDYQHPNADDFGQIPPYPEVDDYEEEDNTPFGPGTCRYGGKVYVSAQQIPRDDPCDFCFCFRSDIICLQQSCPPPIPGCHEEPIQGFCCPRYECPVSMATVLNLTTTTTTTTTTLPPHFLHHAYRGSATRTGCQIQGKAYRVGEIIKSKSGPCLHCTCGGDGQMKCDPKVCSPQPMIQQMIAAATASRRR